MAKKGKKKVKAPSGLDISRDGTKYQLSWSRGGGYTSQDARYFIKTNKNSVPKDDSFSKLSPSAKATSKKIPFDNSKYYPTTTTMVQKIICYVKGKKGSGSWHKSDRKTLELKAPKKPTLTGGLVSGTNNESAFSWDIDVATNDNKPFVNYEWETLILKNSSIEKGSEVNWNVTTFNVKVNDNNSEQTSSWFAQHYGWTQWGKKISGYGTGTSFERSVIEDSGIFGDSKNQDYSYTRWFRIRSRGPAGASDWAYYSHTYSYAEKAHIDKVTVDDYLDGYRVSMTWNVYTNVSSPTDVTVPEYAVVVPQVESIETTDRAGSSMKYPDDQESAWTSVGNIEDTRNKSGITFTIPEKLQLNHCLYVRVSTYHDDLQTRTQARLAKYGKLSTPNISRLYINPAEKRVELTVTNNSIVNSFIAVHYCIGESTIVKGTIGIVTGTGEQNKVFNLPDWGNEKISIGLQTIIGLYTPKTLSAEGVTYFTLYKTMESDIVWDEGVPQAPSNITATAIEDRMSIEVTWDWPWTQADTTELSWADHEDAWESTDEPSTYMLSSIHTGRWRIAGLSVGTWYVRLRLIKTTDDGYIYGLYSDIIPVKLAAQPLIPSMTILPPAVSVDDTFKCTWAYSAVDGTQQQQAEICECEVEDKYTEIEEPDPEANPKELKWYELVDESYILTEDTSIVSGKTYYTYETNGVKSYGLPIAQANSAQSMTFSVKDLGWQAGTKHYLCVRVTSTAGEQSANWSEPALIDIVEPLVVTIDSVTPSENFAEYTYEIDEVTGDTKTTMALKELPITVTASGVQDDGTMEFSILRDADYHIDRPDENDLEGYEDEVIASQIIDGSGSVTFDSMIFNQTTQEWEAGNLIRPLDDTARYRIEVTGRDTYGQVASATPIKFEVHWTHQAIEPEADIEIDEENYVAYITPAMPASGYVAGDTCDIYRLSIDKPQLIVEGAKFGTKYVDPYPTLGKYGGHRIVYKTKNGDYKLPKPSQGAEDDGDFAMADFEKDEGDFLDVFAVIIDFGDDRVILPFDISLSHTWNKDFTETKYLGGSVIGDWNPAVSRTGSIETRVLLDDRKPDELTTIEALRRLAVYSGVCHVRTPDGSTFAADVEVSENREERWVSKISSFSMTVTRVDSEGFDGELYSDWIVSQEEV